MRYLTLIPDYTQTCLKDDFKGYLDVDELYELLPDNLIQVMNIWHEKYKLIIPLDKEERKSRFKEIEVLDEEGLEIVKELSQYLGEVVKIRYFSEGLVKYLGN